MLARIDRDVIAEQPAYCIIQGGTNDLYWAMAEANGSQETLDNWTAQMRNNTREMVQKCLDAGIHPVIGTLIPRTGATGIYKKALYDHNDWIINFANSNPNVDYVDFFHAELEGVTLEYPVGSGNLNPILDGDAEFDIYGNIIKQGRGIHCNRAGYRIMAYAIPLSLFQTIDTGLKLYLDSECTREEIYDNSDPLNPYYLVKIDNLRMNTSKRIVRYVKNVGVQQSMFVMYPSDEYNVLVRFVSEDGLLPYGNGLIQSGKSQKVIIDILPLDKDIKASVKLHLAGRTLSLG